MAKAIPIPIPLRGLNTISPDLPLEAGYARELTNYSIVNGRLRMRPSITKSSTILGVTPVYSTSRVLWWEEGFPASYSINADKNIYNLATGAVAGTITSASSSALTPPDLVKHLNLSLIMGGNFAPRNSTALFSAWPFTTIAIDPDDITCGCSYKGRLYVCDGSTIEYSSVGQVSGAMYDSFDISEFLNNNSIIRMFSYSFGGNLNENVLVLFGAGGQVLVYQGDYPSSSTWNLVANYNMPPPMQKGFVEIDGDLLVTTRDYVYFLSDLLTDAKAAYENSISKQIENLWRNCNWVSSHASTSGSYAFYDSNYDAFIFNTRNDDLVSDVANYMPNATSTEKTIFLVYFRKYQSWALWLAPRFTTPLIGVGGTLASFAYGIAQATDNKYVIMQMNLATDLASDITEDGTEIDITTSWKTPFINAFRGNIQKVAGVRPYFLSSVNGFLNKIRLIFDYSDYNSQPYGFYTQPTVTQINPGNYADAQVDVPTTTWDNYSPFSSVSGAGGGVSLQITQQRKTGSADTQLNEIYSATMYVEDGGEMI